MRGRIVSIRYSEHRRQHLTGLKAETGAGYYWWGVLGTLGSTVEFKVDGCFAVDAAVVDSA